MMTKRELMYSTLEFRNQASEIPMDLWSLPWADLHEKAALNRIRADFDFAMVSCGGARLEPSPTVGDPYAAGLYIDEWNARFYGIQPGVIGEVKEPIITDDTYEDTSAVRFPEELLRIDADRVNRFCDGSDHFVMGGCCPRPFERLQFLRGSENVYLDLMDETKGFAAFVRKLHAFYLREMEVWAKTTRVDGLSYMDDWGAQKSLLIHPELWRKYFKPCYRDYIDLAHAYGKKIFMHSDGYTLEIIPDLIELGLDALNTQIFCIGIDKLEPFAGKITFWGEIDRQHLLPFGTTAEIDSAVKKVKRTLWKDGGVIGQCEFGAGAKGENVYQVYKSFRER